MKQNEILSFASSKTNVQEFFLSGLKILGGGIALSLAAQVAFPLFFTPVPFTMATLAVLFLGANYGKSKAAWMVLTYYSGILMGLPVLAFGNVDPSIFIGMRGGYVFGYLAQAYLMGFLVEKFASKNAWSYFIAATIAVMTQLLCGMLWMSCFVGISAGFSMGFVPFISTELFKVFLITGLMSGKKRILK